MSEKTHTYLDRSRWGPGPWDGEPDRVEWVDEATGLSCAAIRRAYGAWCGYVAVPSGHPWHRVAYGRLPCREVVHGALSYARPWYGGVAHLRGDQGLWWVGFDTAHPGDLPPAAPDRGGTYRTLAYVKAECARLAQAVANAVEVPRGEERTSR